MPKIKLNTGSTVTKHESLEMLNEHSKRPSSPGDALKAARSMHELEFTDSDQDVPSNRKEIVQRTKRIAAIAAQKRNSQKQMERTGSRIDKLNHHEKTIIPLQSVHEVPEPDNADRNYLTISRLLEYNNVYNTPNNDHDDNISIATLDRRSELMDGYSNSNLKYVKYKGNHGYNDHDDTASIITLDRRSEMMEVHSNTKYSKHKGGGGGLKRMTEKQLAEKQRRKGLGYESSGRVLYMPSRGGFNRSHPALEMQRTLGKKFSPRSMSMAPDTHQTGKVKYPIIHHAGE